MDLGIKAEPKVGIVDCAFAYLKEKPRELFRLVYLNRKKRRFAWDIATSRLKSSYKQFSSVEDVIHFVQFSFRPT